MNKIRLVKELEKHPMFTFNEFVRMGGKGVKYSRTYLYRLKKEGLIFQIERGNTRFLMTP